MDSRRAQKYARVTGLLYLISMVGGAFGEVHVPQSLLAANSLGETAQRISGSVGLFRASFIAYLVEATCDITLSMLLYVLLRPVNRNLSLLAAFFGLISTAVFASGEIFYFSAALPSVDAHVGALLPPESKQALSYLGLTIFGYVFGIFSTFYGTAAVVRGVLIFRSRYLPRSLGVVLVLGGLSFIAENIHVVVAPEFPLPFLVTTVPMALAMLSMMLWLLVKGVNRARWDEIESQG